MKSCFPDEIQAWLHSNGSLQEAKSGGKVENVRVTRWQADPHIAKEYLDKKAAVIFFSKNVVLVRFIPSFSTLVKKF